MEWKREILGNLVALFALGFFLIPLYGYYGGQREEHMYIYTFLAFLSLSIAVVLAIIIEKRGLETEGAKRRGEWIEEGIPIILVPLGYGLCVFMVVFGIYILVQSNRIEILVGMVISAFFLFLLFRWIKKRYESKHKHQDKSPETRP